MLSCINPIQSSSSSILINPDSPTNLLLASSLSSSILWTIVTSSFLLASNHIDKTDGIITNISVIQTWNWFMALTRFEGVFLGFILLHICALQYIGILPININTWLGGNAGGKRRRRRKRDTFFRDGRINSNVEPQQDVFNDEDDKSYDEIESTVEKLLSILNHIDKEKCVLRSLCELQNYVMTSQNRSEKVFGKAKSNQRLPEGIELILSVFSKKRRKRQLFNFGDYKKFNSNSTSSIIQLYEDAIKNGDRLISRPDLGNSPNSSNTDKTEELSKTNSNFSNSTTTNNDINNNLCFKLYSECSLSRAEILSFVKDMHFDDIF